MANQNLADHSAERSRRSFDFDALGRSPALTSLDRVLLRAIHERGLQITGSTPEADLETSITELLRLNAERKQTYFHRGYFDSVFQREKVLSAQGPDQESKMWYVYGRLAACLVYTPAQCADLLNSAPEVCDELFRDEHPERLQLLLTGIYPTLRDGGFLIRALPFLTNGIKHLAGEEISALAAAIIEDASSQLRDGDAGPALSLLDSVPEFNISQPDTQGSLGRRRARKKAQCLLMLGQTGAAESQLQQLAELAQFDESLDALADLGLSAGGFRILYSITPGKTAEEHRSLADALSRGRDFFEQAVKQATGSDPTRARNAQLALGVLHLTSEKPNASLAANHLNLALAGMLKQPTSYAQGDLIAWARLLLGISILELCEPAQLRVATVHIQDALRSNVPFPALLWARCLAAAALFDDKSLLDQVATELLRVRGPEIFDLIRNSGALETSPALRSLYVEMLSPERRAVDKLADDWELILGCALRGGQIDLASQILDELEGLAHTWDVYADRFLRILDDTKMFSPAWQLSDVEVSRLGLLEAGGRFAEAVPLLQAMFWKRLSDKSHESQTELAGIVEHLREIRASPSDIEILESHLPVEEPEVETDELREQLARGATVRILFVGGDERQGKHDDSIREKVQSQAPGISIEFIHPGWGSQWKPICDRVRTRLHEYDAIVLSPLVRTNMGRCIRAISNDETPWFACPARGPEFVSRTVIHAARRCLEIRRAAPKI